jgi:hypothetical protein
MDTASFGMLQGIGGYINVFFHGAGEGTDGGPGHGFGYFHHRVEVAGAGNGKASFYYIHAELLQRFGYFYFLYSIQLAAGHLLSIAQGGVENV